MARFRFSMQNILNVREKLEQQAKNDYAQANARLLEEEEKVNQLLERQHQAEQVLKELLNTQLSIVEVKKKENAVEIIKSYVEQQRLVVKRCEKAVEIAREKLQEAMQERKIYEKLREKAFEEFVKEEALKEQKEVDERSSFQYGTASKSEE